MDIKLLFGIISGILGVFCFFPYLRDTLKKKTAPHAYTWLIWSLLQIISIVAILVSGGGYYGTLGISVGAALCLLIFFLSLKYGTKNITRFDTFCFVAALIAIPIWILTKNPVYSVILITAIDFTGFIPTLRKGYQEPWSETTSLYFIGAFSGVLAILALNTYSVSTVLYLADIMTVNAVFFIILTYRRSLVPKPH